MQKLKMIFWAIRNALYVSPRNWLRAVESEKLLRFLASALLMLVLFFLLGSLWTAVLLASVVAVFKAVVADRITSKGKEDADGFWADIMGVGFGMVFLYIMKVCIIIHYQIF